MDPPCLPLHRRKDGFDAEDLFSCGSDSRPIAEEVTKVYPELVTRGPDGKVASVQYHELIPMLLNELQRQQREFQELKAALTARLTQLEAARAASLASR